MTPSELKEARLMAGLTQRALARALGVSISAITFWETGRRPISRLTEIAVRAVCEKAA